MTEKNLAALVKDMRDVLCKLNDDAAKMRDRLCPDHLIPHARTLLDLLCAARSLHEILVQIASRDYEQPKQETE